VPDTIEKDATARLRLLRGTRPFSGKALDTAAHSVSLVPQSGLVGTDRQKHVATLDLSWWSESPDYVG
jgi:hypothetical protein